MGRARPRQQCGPRPAPARQAAVDPSVVCESRWPTHPTYLSNSSPQLRACCKQASNGFHYSQNTAKWCIRRAVGGRKSLGERNLKKDKSQVCSVGSHVKSASERMRHTGELWK